MYRYKIMLLYIVLIDIGSLATNLPMLILEHTLITLEQSVVQRILLI